MREDPELLWITSGGSVLNCALRGPEAQWFGHVHICQAMALGDSTTHDARTCSPEAKSYLHGLGLN